MVIDAKLLASDRALDQAWRGGVRVARAVTHASELSDRCDVVLTDAQTIVSDHHACNPGEALSRLVFVSQYTNRSLRDIAGEVIASAVAENQGLAISPPRPYRFTL